MSLIDSITVVSNVSPPVVINHPLSGGGAAPSGLRGWILSVLRPEVTISGDFGTKTIAPYGAPNPVIAPVLIMVIIGGFILWRF